MIKLIDIIDFLGNEVIEIYGEPSKVKIKYLKAADEVDEYTLDFINTIRIDKQKIAEMSLARAIIVAGSIIYSDSLKAQSKVIIVVDQPKLAIAKIGNEFFAEKIKPRIEPSAIIHPDAKIGKDVYIGTNVKIGKCIIGNYVQIFSNVVIHDGVTIGNYVVIKPGAVLGFEGFGFEKDSLGNLLKFPQLGKLRIHDHVEIGANTCIDRGALKDTIIGYGTKINNLCHIAHNVVIGQNVIITGHANISGSTIIEDYVWISPNVSLRGHQRIGKGATIGMGAVVTKDVPAGETWIGNPAKKI
jgi:UDP-3-O-[3-hydroxymyristoyl] glucosamine N-acyltransferase